MTALRGRIVLTLVAMLAAGTGGGWFLAAAFSPHPVGPPLGALFGCSAGLLVGILATGFGMSPAEPGPSRR